MLRILRTLQGLLSRIHGSPKQIFVGISEGNFSALFVEVYWENFKCRVGVTEILLEDRPMYAAEQLLRQINQKYDNKDV